jgi:hypothetical protein
MIQHLNVELYKVLQYTNLIGELKYNLSTIINVIWTMTCTLCMLDGPKIIIDPYRIFLWDLKLSINDIVHYGREFSKWFKMCSFRASSSNKFFQDYFDLQNVLNICYLILKFLCKP